ncbi:hypothetical protein [Gloeomargarita sp.]
MVVQRENSPAGAQDGALVGLRRAEVVALQLSDYEPTENRLRAGKGNKERWVYRRGRTGGGEGRRQGRSWAR